MNQTNMADLFPVEVTETGGLQVTTKQANKYPVTKSALLDNNSGRYSMARESSPRTHSQGQAEDQGQIQQWSLVSPSDLASVLCATLSSGLQAS